MDLNNPVKEVLKMSTAIGPEDLMQREDMLIYGDEQFQYAERGGWPTLQTLENKAQDTPWLKWRVQIDGKWYSRKGEKIWEAE